MAGVLPRRLAPIALLGATLGAATLRSANPAETPRYGPGFYAAPDGTSSGDGSIGAPWDLQTALSSQRSVVPGSTIWLRGGRYSANPGGPYGFSTALKGAPGAPITVAGYPAERPILDAAGNTVAALLIGGNGDSASDVIFRDFEITSSGGERRRKESGLWIRDSTRIVFANLVVHDLPGQGIGFWFENSDSTVSGCLLYYNGSSRFDHGIYGSNPGPKMKVIRDNLLLYNYGYGIHLYGSGSKGAINSFVVDGNIAAQNGRLVDTGSGASTSGSNILVGGETPGDSISIRDNLTYWAPWPRGSAWKDVAQAVGYAAPLTNVTISGNYFVGGTLFREIGSMTMTGNTFVRGARGLATKPPPGNAYLDSDTAVRTFIRRNAFEPGRANVAVYNWPKRPAVSVDVSGVLAPGVKYEIRNAFDFYGTPVASGTYRGAPISIPMGRLSIAAPAGFPSPPSVAPEFGAFVLRSIPAGRRSPG